MLTRVLIIGDSSILPGHSNLYEDTWLYMFKSSYHKSNDIIAYCQRGLTTDVLVNQGGGVLGDFPFVPKGADVLEYYMPNIIILQLGIVDCAPRLFNKDKIFVKIISRLPKFIKDKVYSFKLKITGRKIENSYVTLEKFKSNLNNYFKRCENIGVNKVILVGIMMPSAEMIKKNKNIVVNVTKYNNVLKQMQNQFNMVKYIEPLNQSHFADVLYDDGYHPNPYGNKILFHRINKEFINDLPNDQNI
jgi:hypothetical protein